MPRIVKALLVVLLAVLFLGAGQGKTVKIGNHFWLTEQNSFDKLIQQARKDDKLILMVFSATWCMPCQEVKSQVFAIDEFQSVSKRVLCVYIEQTEIRGQEYNKKFSVKSFPTFKMLDRNGTELETGRPERTVKGFLKWIDAVEKGHSSYALRQRVKKNPQDREALFLLSQKLEWEELDAKIELLHKIVQMKPDPHDEFTQKANESLVSTYLMLLEQKKDDERKKYADKIQPEITAIFDRYYPDQFQYSQKGSVAYSSLIRWHRANNQPRKARQVFLTFLNKMSFAQGATVFLPALMTLLDLSMDEEAEQLLAMLDHYQSLNPMVIENESFTYEYLQLFPAIVDYFKEQKKQDKAKKYASLYYQHATKSEAIEKSSSLKRFVKWQTMKFGEQHGLLINECLHIIDGDLMKAQGLKAAQLYCEKGKLLVKKGDTAKAQILLINAAKEKQVSGDNLTKRQRAEVYNSLAWTLYELKLVNEAVLTLAQKSVALSKNANNLDTLACIYAELGDFKKALKKVKNERARAEFEKNIERFQAELNKK